MELSARVSVRNFWPCPLPVEDHAHFHTPRLLLDNAITDQTQRLRACCYTLNNQSASMSRSSIRLGWRLANSSITSCMSMSMSLCK